ncbi:hypothetical protein AKJ16_DCAP24086, partial [Drosera capensis]
ENQSVFYGHGHGHGHGHGRPHLKVEADNVSNGPSPSLKKNSSENGTVGYDRQEMSRRSPIIALTIAIPNPPPFVVAGGNYAFAVSCKVNQNNKNGDNNKKNRTWVSQITPQITNPDDQNLIFK